MESSKNRFIKTYIKLDKKKRDGQKLTSEEQFRYGRCHHKQQKIGVDLLKSFRVGKLDVSEKIIS